MSDAITKRLLIIGWDAADWKVIDTLFAHGAMPNVRRLVDQGVRANLASLEPRLSPILWTSIATGKTADKHGILNFAEPDPLGKGVRIASSTSRKTKALWNILTQAGLRVNVVSWYASHPAEPINGVCVSNLFQEQMPPSPAEPWPLPANAIHPPVLGEKLADLRLHPAEVGPQEVLTLVPRLQEAGEHDGRVAILAKSIAYCASVHNAATAILSDDKNWNCSMVFYDTIDTVGHNFMQYHPPRMPHVGERDFELYRDVMFNLYQFHDLMLGALLDLAGPETTVMLLSDHGFYSDHRRPNTTNMTHEQRAAIEASWHRPFGILAMEGPGIKRHQHLYGASLLDIAPTALALLGLPVGADMMGRVLAESFDRPIQRKSIFSWDLEPGEAGLHAADLRQDPFEASETIKQLVDLGYMAPPPEDAQTWAELTHRESLFNLGLLHMSMNRAHEATAIFEQLSHEHPDNRRYFICLTKSLYLEGDYKRCALLLRQWLHANSGDIDARVGLATALAASGASDQALAELTRIESARDGRLDIEAPLGDIYLRLRRWEDADRHYRNALGFDPELAHVHNGLARSAIARGQFEQAADHCLDAVRLVHFYPEAHHGLGVALAWLKDYEHAIKSFNVAVSMKPDFLESHRYLASIYRHLGDRENALKHRQIAERIIAERGTSSFSIDLHTRSEPMGPQDWVTHMGLKPSVETSG